MPMDVREEEGLDAREGEREEEEEEAVWWLRKEMRREGRF
jgi:hypothetical protein